MSRPRRPVVAAAVVAAATAVVAGIVVVNQSDGSDGRDGSRRLPDGPPVRLIRVPDAYQITYRVEVPGGTSTSERVTVRRPFDSRRETFAEPAVGGDPTSVQVATFGRLRLQTGDGAPTVIAVPPGPAPADIRLDAAIDDAVAAGLLVRRERREVTGRPCQVYRSRQPLLAAELEPPTRSHHTDSCVDAAGLLVEELVVADGKPAGRRVAVAVDEQPVVPDRLFRTGPQTVPGREGGGAVQEVAADSSTPGRFWELGTLPSRFTHHGRYAVVPPQVAAFTDPVERHRRLGAVVDVLVDGPDVVVVERGGTLGNVDVVPAPPGAPEVDLGPLGTGWLVLGAQGPSVQADLGSGRFVRVLGTIAVDRLTAVARGLREVDGGELRVGG